MPRHARKKSASNIYHVVIKGADSQLLFHETKDYLKYLDILQYYKDECDFLLFAYCLMSNHVHLLIQTTTTTIDSVFRRINTTYAGWFNLKYNRTGYVQDGRYYSEPIETLESIRNVIRYIHYNPTKAGLEAAPGKSYKWNSFKLYLQNSSELLDSTKILQILGGEESFIELHKTSPKEKEYIDIHSFRKRIPDDVAQDIILEHLHLTSLCDFSKMSLSDRRQAIISLTQKGISIRQMSRLTGTPRGIVERILKKYHVQNS